MSKIELHHGDCLEVMRTLKENSVNSICCDPPYGISFMGKKWDYDVPEVEVWKEAMRVLKPGGHALIACGTKTQHRMAVNIEDAGFEIRDIVSWIYGSGFPKSHNVGKSINSLETKEWSKISKALDNIDEKSIIEVWKRNLNNVSNAEAQLLKNQTEAGTLMQKSDFVQVNVVEKTSQENKNVSVITAEVNFYEVPQSPQDIKQPTATQNVEANIKQSLNLVKSAEKLSLDQNHLQKTTGQEIPMSIFTAECNVKEWLNENTMVNLKVDEALKTLRGNQKYSNEEITNVLCVVIQNALKHTILSQSKTFQNLDTKSQTECVSAINVTITEYTMECLISNMVDILKSKAVDKIEGNEREKVGEKDYKPGWHKEHTQNDDSWTGADDEGKTITKGSSPYEGWGTALKPAQEFWTLARKPLSEKTIAANVLKHGTGGINIDGCRVGTEERINQPGSTNPRTAMGDGWNKDAKPTVSAGRFPANLIHDGSEEAIEGMQVKGDDKSRFFYTAKASKKERNKGLEGLERFETKQTTGGGGITSPNDEAGHVIVSGDKGTAGKYGSAKAPQKNNHPTVKPIKLMQYLVRLITPKDGTVLDPFMGSGSTGIACEHEGFDFIGIEKNEEYCEIAKARIDAAIDAAYE